MDQRISELGKSEIGKASKHQFSKEEKKEMFRERPLPSPWRILLPAAVILLVTLMAVNFVGVIGRSELIVTITILFFFLLVYFDYFTERMHEKAYANEFENMLFSAALSASGEFSIILRKDGKIAHISASFAKFFVRDDAAFRMKAPDLFTQLGADHLTQERLLSAMQEAKQTEALVKCQDAYGFQRQFTLELVPLKRPRDYSVLRASKWEEGAVSAKPVKTDIKKVDIQPAIAQMLQHFNQPGYILESGHVFGYVNPAFAKAMETTPQELMHSLKCKSLPEAENFRGQISLFDKQGRQKEFHAYQLALPTVEGLKPITCGILTPVEAKKQLEKVEAKQEAPKKDIKSIPQNIDAIASAWQQMMEDSLLPAGIVDKKGIWLYSNAVLRKNLGKIHQDSLLDVLEGADKMRVSALLVGEGKSETIEVKLDKAKENEERVSLYFSPLVGSPLRFLVHVIDKTEVKNLEQQMAHSQKMQAIGQLAGGIAHDFNNLLTAMTGFCDLLLARHPAGDPSFADIMQIKQNSNRAANLVRQLLAFSRKQTLQPEIISITDALAELSSLIRRLIGANIELRMSHGRNLHKVKVDLGQLEQVVINLAVNARDAMAKGGMLAIRTQNVTVDASHPISAELIPPVAEETIAPGEYVMIEVIDTGHGIPKDVISKIFEPFFSTKEIGAGTGLGLATVYGIVKQTGGYIYVASRENQGTNFSIFLKKAVGVIEAKEDAPKSAAIEEKSISQDLTGGGTVLLVEDEEPVRIFSARALSNKGYKILEADCGEAGLKLMKEHGKAIDLVITDVVMPGINGPTMVQEIIQNYPDVKVIFVSGYAEDAFVKTYGSDRKFNFLPKPYTLKQLALKVKEVMQTNKQA